MKQVTVFSKALVLSLLVNVPSLSYSASDSTSIGEPAPAITAESARALGFRSLDELSSYFEISEISVVENKRGFTADELRLTGFELLNGTANTVMYSAASPSIGELISSLAGDIGDIKSWVTLGTKIWDVIKNNQPVVTVQTQTVSVLPLAFSDWRLMETWKGPMAKSYTISAKNLYGKTVISHTYTVAFYHGGSSEGRGQFLANATILPTDVDVSWGFTLNSNVKVGEPLNTGTKQDPVPGVDLGLEWSMSSVLKKTQGVDQFFVRGDGTTSHVGVN